MRVTTKVKVVRISGNNRKKESDKGSLKHLLFPISNLDYAFECSPQ